MDFLQAIASVMTAQGAFHNTSYVCVQFKNMITLRMQQLLVTRSFQQNKVYKESSLQQVKRIQVIATREVAVQPAQS